MRIGNIDLPLGLALAPMAGFTDAGMRAVCRRFGAEYLVCEMVSAKAVVYGDKKTLLLAHIAAEEAPCAIQIFGSEPDILARAAEQMGRGIAGDVRPAAIDVNMGCPVPKVFGNGEGSALMRSPEQIETIVRAVCGATDLPVTVKIRAGVDDAHINAVECAKAAEAGGAAAVAVHGRTRVQLYSGAADRGIIRAVKEAVGVPVFANGDVTDAASALAMRAETGADGLMVGRGAIGNPFVFAEIAAALRGEPYEPPTLPERVEVALEQLSRSVADKGERLAVTEGRKQIALYLRGFRGAADIRRQINAASTYAEVAAALQEAKAQE